MDALMVYLQKLSASGVLRPPDRLI